MMTCVHQQASIQYCLLSLFSFVTMLPIAPAHATNALYGDMIINEVTSIHDADTFAVNIKNWPANIGQKIPVRIKGIDTLKMSSHVLSKNSRRVMPGNSPLKSFAMQK